MTESADFPDLLHRVRAGDPVAAAELVRRFEPELRRAVRMRLTDPRLRRVFDSSDICQSVLYQFFTRIEAGQFDLHQPTDLLRLLAVMTRNKLRHRADHHRAARRDLGRRAGGAELLEDLASPDPGPTRVLVARDQLEEVGRHLSAADRYLAEQLAEGRGWVEIGRLVGCSAEAVRKRWSRARARLQDKFPAEVNRG